jgi:hypothetical protein
MRFEPIMKKDNETMKNFFERKDVKALQEIQKQNPHGSRAHRDAYARLNKLTLAASGKTLAQLGNPY